MITVTDHHEDDIMPHPIDAPTELHPTVRRPAADAPAEATRLDVHRLHDVADPTIGLRYDEQARAYVRPLRVSPPGAHTGGTGAVVDRLNLALDAREAQQAVDRVTPGTASKAWRRTRDRKVSLRDAAARRAAARLRHERHMEVLETLRAYLGIVCLAVLLALVGAMASVAFGILAGWYTWAPVR